MRVVVTNTKVLISVAFLLAASSCGGDGDESAADKTNKNTCEANDSTDGTNACGLNQTCEAGNYCYTEVYACFTGCRSELDCARGDYCDLRNPSKSPGGAQDVGTCRKPGSECKTDDGGPVDGAGCLNVQGNYLVGLASSSPAVCKQIWTKSQMCSITQTNCDISVRCDQDQSIFQGGTLNNNSLAKTIQVEGMPVNCKMDFTGTDYFTWSCSASGILCEGTGRSN